VLQALAIVFALAAVLCIAAAIVMLVRQDPNGIAVLLNVLR
jgi:hypothetical protein